MAYHVIPYGGKWSVRRSGGKRASCSRDTAELATIAARDLAKKHGGPIYVHGRNGLIQSREEIK